MTNSEFQPPPVHLDEGLGPVVHLDTHKGAVGNPAGATGAPPPPPAPPGTVYRDGDRLSYQGPHGAFDYEGDAAGKWTIVAGLAQQAETAVAVEVWLAEQRAKHRPARLSTSTKWNDAVVHGVLDDDLLAEELEVSHSPDGEQTYPGRWKTQTGTIRNFFDWLSRHKEGPKSGHAFLQGSVVDGDRKAAAVRHQDLLVMDLDGGEPLESIHERIRNFGKLALVYTTHSHLKTTTEIKKDALVKWIGDDAEEEPTAEQAVSYLVEVKGYHPAVLEGAFISDTKHTSRGVMAFVEHRPMPKARVVFVLAERFSFSKGGTQAERTKEWKERYAGTARELGLVIDKSCTDLPRLFYLPSHAKGAQFQIDIFPGEFLDLSQMPRVTAAELKGSNPFEAAAKAMGGSAGGTYATTGLKWFFGKYGSRFDLADFLLEVDPDGDRGARSTGAGRSHKCPNDDVHTDAGNEEDRGFFCVNALDSETEQATAKCMHASCAELDRINFVDLACQAAGIKDATELKRWVPELEGEDEEVTPSEEDPQPSDEPSSPPLLFKSSDEARAAIEAIAKDDDDTAIDVARAIGRSADLSAGQVGGLMKKLGKKSGIPLRSLEAERKTGEKARVLGGSSSDDAGVDDDGRAALAEWNRKYAVATLGGKVRILKEPRQPGTMPSFYEVDAFRTLKANDKATVVTGDGETRQEPLTKLWLEWPERRTYEGGIVFEPAGCRKDEYNLWDGFPIVGKQGDWSLLREHVFENICQGNEGYFAWVMTWLAQIFQQPGEKLGSSLVIKGKKGTGKSVMFTWIRKALGSHAIKVNQKKHITGNFNAHQSGVLLMVCEEAFWAGDHEAGGVLKDMVTSDTMMLERKGVDPVEVSNFMRMAMVSNEDWVVPAGLDDERRYMVLECGDGRKQDIEFFENMKHQMNHGGLEAMMWEMMHWTPPERDWSILRTPPKTPWLKEQAEQGTSLGERFFIQLVENGHHQCSEEHKPENPSLLSLHEWHDGINTEVNDARLVEDAGQQWLLWPIAKLRWHYGQFTGETARNRTTGRAGSDSAMVRHAEHLLGATRERSDGKPWQWKDRGRCIAVPMRSDVLKRLDERGIPYSRTDCD